DLASGPRAISGFYDRLDGIGSWETLPPTIAIHRVLGTPDPFRYERFWPTAIKMLKKIAADANAVESHVSTAGLAPSRCYVTQSDVSALPLPPGSAFTVRTAPAAPAKGDTTTATDGPSGQGTPATPAAQPTETRFDAACGTPVVAATRGVVELVSDNAEAGPWLIKVRWDEKNVTTSYAHAQDPTVTDGQVVLAGDVLAEVGDLGAVDRCSLGLSMTTREDGKVRQLDPLGWLTANGAAVGEQPTRIGETTFRIASYNVLGHHLTAPGGGRPGFAPGTTRVANGIGRLESYGASIVVLNEFESPQAGVLLADGDWGLHRATFNNTFRDGNGSGNAIAWRTDTWKMVDATEFTVPWQVTLHMPVVRLEHVDTKAQVIVIGVHNPASTSVKGNQSGARTVARQIELAYITDLHAAMPGVPILFAGDMNERSEAFCGFTGTGILQSSAGGSVGGGCSVPPHGPVDWIFGTLDIDFTGQIIDRGTLGRISDHPLLFGDVVFPEHEIPSFLVERGDPALAE
ncbi:MAG: peptidoglycan DD-metalloendopeptidase family protein, partial [Actinomycetota bacterium]|nr:peptidoglycan DD-metalloendopeptidase family protein [Actinomycetota bacterium]